MKFVQLLLIFGFISVLSAGNNILIVICSKALELIMKFDSSKKNGITRLNIGVAASEVHTWTYCFKHHFLWTFSNTVLMYQNISTVYTNQTT